MVIKIKMAPPHPGAFIRQEVLEPLELSVSRAADVLGVRRATLSSLVNGNASLSPEMALRIDKAFGLDVRQMLQMQAWYDAYAIEQRRDKISVEAYEPV